MSVLAQSKQGNLATFAHPLLACHDCDLLYRKRPLQNGQRALCARCGAVLYHQKADTISHTFNLALTSLILFILANSFPFMTFKLQGQMQETLLYSGAKELYLQGFWQLGILVFLVGIFFPLVKILGTLYVILPLRFNRRFWKAKEVFRLVEALTPWSMMEVFMLGVIVGYVKLIDLATIVLGISLYSFAALIILVAATGATLNPEEVWGKLETAK